MKKTVALLCAATAVLGLTSGCRGAVIATGVAPGSAPAATASTPATTATQKTTATQDTAEAATVNAAAAGPGGPGTVTLTLTEPVQASGHAGTSVTCSTGRLYVASAGSATVDGYHLSFTVRAARYHGPGSYPAAVTLRLDRPSGVVTSISAVPVADAQLTGDGGSFTVDATGTDGRTLAASLSWTCG